MACFYTATLAWNSIAVDTVERQQRFSATLDATVSNLQVLHRARHWRLARRREAPRRSLPIRLAAARPDELGGLAVVIVEQVGVDGCHEARIVELEAEIATGVGLRCGPGRTEFDLADENPVAGSRFVAAFGLGPACDENGRRSGYIVYNRNWWVAVWQLASEHSAKRQFEN